MRRLKPSGSRNRRGGQESRERNGGPRKSNNGMLKRSEEGMQKKLSGGSGMQPKPNDGKENGRDLSGPSK
jgi:hypothetical protein